MKTNIIGPHHQCVRFPGSGVGPRVGTGDPDPACPGTTLLRTTDIREYGSNLEKVVKL